MDSGYIGPTIHSILHPSVFQWTEKNENYSNLLFSLYFIIFCIHGCIYGSILCPQAFVYPFGTKKLDPKTGGITNDYKFKHVYTILKKIKLFKALLAKIQRFLYGNYSNKGHVPYYWIILEN